jgi:predicted DsbA family dithiol-disulfide isomerase
MTESLPTELWQSGEYYCPWTYIAVVRLRRVMPSLADRLTLRLRAYPLELIDGFAAPRDVLAQEWWLAAIQEPHAAFAAHSGADWPTTTMPAFEAAWCAARQGDEVGADFDLRVRRAFFAEGRDIGSREVMREIAGEAGLDRAAFERDFASGMAASAVVEEARLGREQYRVRGTPTLMLSTGKKIRHPIAYPAMENDLITAISPLTCAGDGCIEATRAAIEAALVG